MLATTCAATAPGLAVGTGADEALEELPDHQREVLLLHFLQGRSTLQIAADRGVSQPTISHHMSILTKAGLVEAKKLGQWMWYRRNETALREFARALRESL